MIEPKEGKGKLVSRDTGKEYQVLFEFTIVTNLVKRPHGVAVGKSDANGKVSSIDGAVLPDGDYDLYEEDGEIMHVRNMGFGQWVIEADV